MKENINEHDMTKKMMDIMRGGFKKLITEEHNTDDEYARDYVIDAGPGHEAYEAELKRLETVDTDVKLIDLKIYPNDSNVISKGVYKETKSLKGSGVTFTFDKGEQEPTLSMQDVSEPGEFLIKLQEFFKTWKEEWIQLLKTSYPPKTENEQS